MGVLLGHEKNDSDDISPPFAVVNDKGEQFSSDGQNMKETYGGGYTGATKFHGDRDILRRSSWRG